MTVRLLKVHDARMLLCYEAYGIRAFCASIASLHGNWRSLECAGAFFPSTKRACWHFVSILGALWLLRASLPV